MLIKSKQSAPAADNVKLSQYKARLKIDQDGLDKEVAQHAVLFQEVGEEYTRLVSIRDKLKERCDVEASRLAIAIRKKGDKVTAAEVNERVTLDSGYRTLAEEYREVSSEASKWFALKEAFHARGYMLRELCGLFASGYWSVKTTRTGAAGEVAAKVGREGQKYSLRPSVEKKS